MVFILIYKKKKKIQTTDLEMVVNAAYFEMVGKDVNRPFVMVIK